MLLSATKGQRSWQAILRHARVVQEAATKMARFLHFLALLSKWLTRRHYLLDLLYSISLNFASSFRLSEYETVLARVCLLRNVLEASYSTVAWQIWMTPQVVLTFSAAIYVCFGDKLFPRMFYGLLIHSTGANAGELIHQMWRKMRWKCFLLQKTFSYGASVLAVAGINSFKCNGRRTVAWAGNFYAMSQPYLHFFVIT